MFKTFVKITKYAQTCPKLCKQKNKNVQTHVQTYTKCFKIIKVLKQMFDNIQRYIFQRETIKQIVLARGNSMTKKRGGGIFL